MIYEATSETGAKYVIDLDIGLWIKITRDGYINPSERIWSLQVGTALSRPWEDPDNWQKADAPEIGKHLYLAAKDVWYVSTKIIGLREVDSLRPDSVE